MALNARRVVPTNRDVCQLVVLLIDNDNGNMYRWAWVPTMPWSCPKCGVLVGTGAPSQPEPRVETTYTCPVCHLELAFNPAKKKMVPASLPPDRSRRKPRSVA